LQATDITFPTNEGRREDKSATSRKWRKVIKKKYTSENKKKIDQLEEKNSIQKKKIEYN